MNKWEQLSKDYAELSQEFNFIDEYGNGGGWWSNPERQARIVARQEAWVALGFNITTGSWLSHNTFLPSTAKKMGERITKLVGIGRTTFKKIQELPEDADILFLSIYNNLYDNKDSKTWRFVEKNFNRVYPKRQVT